MPRSGSTLLHGLLAQDPANRVPRTWEMLLPSPAPEHATYDSDPRIAKVERELRWFHRLAPDFQVIHDVGARMPEECTIIIAHSFVSSQFSSMYDVPSYSRWCDAQDSRPKYELHRRFLQHLQHRFGARRWILKAPVHLNSLPGLLAVYPDARMVMTHRDPMEVLASEASLHATLRRPFTRAVDPMAVGREVSAVHGRRHPSRPGGPGRGPGSPGTVLRCRVHGRLARCRLSVVRRMYDHFDLPLTPAVEARMRRFLAENPKEKHGPHRYTLAQFGLDPDEEQRRYRAYRERFLAAETPSRVGGERD